MSWVAGVVFACLAAMVALALAFVDSDALKRQVQTKWLPQVSERLGRNVTVDEMEVGLWPQPSVRLGAVRVEGEGEQPLFQAEQASVRVSWWRLIRSRGREFQINEVLLDDVSAHLVRRADGSWPIQDLARRMKSDAKSEKSETPSVDLLALRNGVVIFVDHAAPEGASPIVVKKIELTVSDVGATQPAKVKLKASVGGENRNIDVDLKVGALSKPVTSELSGNIKLKALPLNAIEPYLPHGLSRALDGGSVSLESELSTVDDNWVATGKSALRGKSQGEPLELTASIYARMPKGVLARVRGNLSDVVARGSGVDLEGQASFDAAARKLDLSVTGPRLDVDEFLASTKDEHPNWTEKRSRLLSSKASKRLKSLHATAKANVGRLTAHGVTVSDVRVDAVMEDGVIRMQEANGKLYGGVVDGKNSLIDLGGKTPRWRLTGRLRTVDLERAPMLAAEGGEAGGLLDGSANVTGSGVGLSELLPALSGVAHVAVKNAHLPGRNLPALLRAELVASLDRLGVPTFGASVPPPSSDGTALGDFSTSLAVDDGWLVLQNPISVQTPMGEMRLGGRVGLDRRLALVGTVMLGPSFVSRLTGGKVTPETPVAVPFQVGGTLAEAEVTGIDVEKLAEVLVTDQIAPQVKEKIRRQLGTGPLKNLPNLFGF